MPGRGHKVASRQAQLGQRRRRQSRTPAPATTRTRPAGPSPATIQPDDPATQTAVAAAPVTSSVRGAPRAQPQYHPSVLDHIGPELRRIAATGLTALAVLVALSILVL